MEHNDLSQKICSDCWSKTMAFHSFYKTIRSVQYDVLAKFESIVSDHYGFAKKPIKMEIPSYPEVEVIMGDAGLDFMIDNLKSDDFGMDDIGDGQEFMPTEEDDEYFEDELLDDEVEEKPKSKIVAKRKCAAFRIRMRKCISFHTGNSPKKRKPPIPKKVKREKFDSSSPEKPASATRKRSSSSAPTKRRSTQDNDPAGDDKIRMFFKMDCDFCGIIFQTFSDAKTHYKNVHKQAGYITCCGKQFFRRSRALSHITKHLDVKSYM